MYLLQKKTIIEEGQDIRDENQNKMAGINILQVILLNVNE
jgi:hypothetical protein